MKINFLTAAFDCDTQVGLGYALYNDGPDRDWYSQPHLYRHAIPMLANDPVAAVAKLRELADHLETYLATHRHPGAAPLHPTGKTECRK